MKACFTFILICCSFLIHAQGKKKILTESVLWEITDPQTGNTSHLLGSMHPVRADSFVYKFTRILDLLANCRLYACETLGLADSVEAQKFIASFNELPKKSFKKWFGKDSAMVDDFFVRHFNLDDFFELPFDLKKRPSQIINVADTNLIMQVSDLGVLENIIYDSIQIRSGLHRQASPSFDEAINALMATSKKPILQLDDARFLSQSVLAGNFYTRSIVGYIKTFNLLTHSDSAALKKDRYYGVVKAMKQYDAAATFDYILKDKAVKVHVERNKTWLKKLIPELKKGNAFIVVGAGHLLGDPSCLIPALRKKGYSVTPVKLIPVSK